MNEVVRFLAQAIGFALARTTKKRDGSPVPPEEIAEASLHLAIAYLESLDEPFLMDEDEVEEELVEVSEEDAEEVDEP